MAEYRAFDKSGVIIDHKDLDDTDAAVAWGISVVVKNAALVEKLVGDNWVCFQESRGVKTIPAQPDR